MMKYNVVTMIIVLFGATRGLSASADSLIASDSFYADAAANADSGVYAVNEAVTSKKNAAVKGGEISGFKNSEWKGNSSIYKPFAAGLSSALVTGAGGSIRYEGRDNDEEMRFVRRSVGDYSKSTTYFVSLLLRTEVIDADGFFYTGFNSYDPTNNNANGIFFGFCGNKESMELVVRQRQKLTAGEYGLVNTPLGVAEVNKTYHLVARIDVNAEGSGERVKVWLNPVSAEDSPVIEFDPKTVYSMAQPNSFSVMTLFAGSFGKTGSKGGGVIVDELRLGTSWDVLFGK